MSRYREADLSRTKTRPVATRPSKVDLTTLARPPGPESAALIDCLPDVLAAKTLRDVVGATAAAARGGRTTLVMAGGHVVQTGCSPCLSTLMEKGASTVVALNGAAAIHDFELAAFGATSEDVEAALGDGTFGMAEETSRLMNAVTREAHERGEGLGEALGRHLVETKAPHANVSLLASAYRRDIPVTVHVAIGTDILHQHASADGAAIGATSLRDFRILAAAIENLSGGVVLNMGSAVILPEVFLKALAVNLNQGREVRDLVTCDFDFIRHYRPAQNVVGRPVAAGRGRGYSLTGHHEILIPLFTAGVVRALSS